MKPFLALALFAVTVAAVSAYVDVDIKAWRKSIKHSKTNERGQTHTLDKYDGPAGGCEVIPMTDAKRARVTEAHNDFRRKIAKGLESRGTPGPQPKAKNMAKVEYDMNLEKVALAWASQCQRGQDDFRDIDGYKFVGQNVYVTGGTFDWPLEVDWRNVTISWFNQVEYMDGSAATKNWTGSNPKVVSPYVELDQYANFIRAEAKKIGCAEVRYEYSVFMRHAICNYGEGAVIGVPLYEAGEPCAGAKECEDGLVVA